MLMARPQAADPDASRVRILAAARELAVRDGMAALSARTVAGAANVSPTTVCTLFGNMAGLRLSLIRAIFEPLVTILDGAEGLSVLDIAAAPLRADDSLPILVTQVAGYAGLFHGEHKALAEEIGSLVTEMREFLAKHEIPKSKLPGTARPSVLADRIIGLYFAASFQLARQPDIAPAQLRLIFGEI